jgi:hypothetical protein
MKIILGVHGLAPKPDEIILNDWWRASILEGLRRNCGITPSINNRFELVYWADICHSETVGDDNPEPYIAAEGTGRLAAGEEGWRDSAIAGLLAAGAKPLDLARRYFGRTLLTDAVLEAKLLDLSLYYRVPMKRRAMHVRLREKLEKFREEPTLLLIAHSMGSIIAHDVLSAWELGPSQELHLCTIGSPLGLPSVKHEVAARGNGLIRTPSVVHRWDNLSDRRDAVCLDTRLADDFAPNDRAVRVTDRSVVNSYVGLTGRGNPHKSYGYLRTPELSLIVRDFLRGKA